MGLIGQYFKKDDVRRQERSEDSDANRRSSSLAPTGRFTGTVSGGAATSASNREVAMTESNLLPNGPLAKPFAPPPSEPAVQSAAKVPAGRPDRIIKTLAVVQNSKTDLPIYTAVLTADGERNAIPPQYRRYAAALLLDATSKAYALLWTNGSEGKSARQYLQERLAVHGYAFRTEYEASEQLIADLNGQASGAKTNLAGLSVDTDDIDVTFNKILNAAVEQGASDIHLEVSKQGALIRFRIHGELYVWGKMTYEEAEQFSRGLYLRSEADTKGLQFDPRQCQDTSIRPVAVSVKDRNVASVKLRFNSRPVYPDNGWDITLRVLRTEADAASVETFTQLGYDSEQVHALEYASAQPRGVTLLVGSTGSGKSTTLRTICYWLAERSGGREKLISVEDPPEYILPGRQTPVLRTEEDITNKVDPFARFLKAAMRSDPDILLVGEIRDEETAKAMTTASLSGHKVLATLHAASPFAAFERLEELGIKLSLLSSPKFISAIVFQRLVPVLCPECSVGLKEISVEALPKGLLNRINRVAAMHDLSAIRFRGPGCQNCTRRDGGPVGVVGRTVIAEVLVPDANILDMIARGDQLGAYRYWRAAGHPNSTLDTRRVAMGRTVLDQAIAKMGQGLLDPRDIEQAAGLLDDQESTRDAHDWYVKYASRVNSASAQRSSIQGAG